MAELISREIRWRAAAEINEIGFASTDKRFARVESEFAQHRVNVMPDRGRVFVGINFEITEMAAFAAKWNVNVHTQRVAWPGWTFDCVEDFAGELWFPESVRRII